MSRLTCSLRGRYTAPLLLASATGALAAAAPLQGQYPLAPSPVLDMGRISDVKLSGYERLLPTPRSRGAGRGQGYHARWIFADRLVLEGEWLRRTQSAGTAIDARGGYGL